MNDEYRFRLFDAAGEAAGETIMVCLDDEAALLLGERFGQKRRVEVWAGDRFVGQVEAPAPVDPPPDPVIESAAPRRFKPFWSGGWRRG
jgi:hypothetical protein